MSSLEQRWQEQYDRLEAFLAAHGRLPRFCCEDKEEESIGSWVRSQRRSMALGRLTVGRIAKLRALPVPGVLDKIAPPDRLEELAAFQRDHGRLPLTTTDKGSDEYRLAHYLIHTLRPKLKNGTLPKGVASRAARIPGAVIFGYRPDQDERLEEVKAFVDDHGHLPRYSAKGSVEESRLAQWVNNTLNKKLDSLGPETIERVEKLRKIVVESKTYGQHRAEHIVEYAEAYLNEHGSLPSASATAKQEKQPYVWLMQRRLKGDAGLYGPALAPRISHLLNEGSGRDARWESRMDDLVDFVKENGKLPTGFEDGPVYRWLATQRAQYRKRSLTPQRENILRAIDGILPPPPKPKKPKMPPEAKKRRVELYLFANPPTEGKREYVRILDDAIEPAPGIVAPWESSARRRTHEVHGSAH